jgi:hypothetical protein
MCSFRHARRVLVPCFSISHSVWRSARRNTARSVSPVVIARVARLPAGRCPWLSLPSRDRRLGEPDGQAPAPAQGGVILRPVRHSVPLLRDVVAAIRIRFERHGTNSRSRKGLPLLLHATPDANPPIRATRSHSAMIIASLGEADRTDPGVAAVAAATAFLDQHFGKLAIIFAEYRVQAEPRRHRRLQVHPREAGRSIDRLMRISPAFAGNTTTFRLERIFAGSRESPRLPSLTSVPEKNDGRLRKRPSRG